MRLTSVLSEVCLDGTQRWMTFILGDPRVAITLPKGKTGTRPTTGNIDAAKALLGIKQRYSDYLNGLWAC